MVVVVGCARREGSLAIAWSRVDDPIVTARRKRMQVFLFLI